MGARVMVPAGAILGVFVLAAATGAHAQPATFLAFDSQPGDYIGGGRTFTLTLADGSITATSGANVVSVAFDGSTWWNLRFAGPQGTEIAPGVYEGAARWPFQSPTGPGLDVSGDGRGCNTLTGRFVVLEAVYDSLGTLEQFAADYEQHCEGGMPALYGSVRYRSAVPAGPRVSVAGARVYEGDFGTKTISVVVSLSGPAAQPVTVQYHTQDGTATAGVDYVAESGTIVLSPGQTSTVIPVGIVGDAVIETDEDFTLVLENAAGAPLGFPTGVVTLLNDDPYKTMLIFDSDSGDYIGGGQQFTLTTSDGTITASVGGDNGVGVHFAGRDRWDLYFAASDDGPLVPGTYENAMRWPFQGAGRPGLSVYGAGRGCNTLTGRFVVLEAVYDSGTVQRLAVDYEQHCEGGLPALFGWVRFNSSAALPLQAFAEGGSAAEDAGTGIVFKVRLDGTASGPVLVDYTTVDGTAIGGVDYVRSFGTLVIPAGASEGLVTVPLIDDADYEGNETFELHLTGASGALVGGAVAVGTILDDDPAPVVRLGDVTIREGDPGRVRVARVPVTSSSASGQGITLTYAAVSGTAVAGEDFVAAAGTWVIPPHQTSTTIDVTLVGDLEPEADETFTVVLYAAAGAVIGVGEATVTVEDDDGPADYYTVTPCRLVDSRLAAPPLRSDGALVFRGAGVCGVPTTAKAVVLNVAAVSPTAAGHFRIGPTGTPRPETSILNFVAGQTRAAGPVISMLGLNDALTLYAVMAGGSTHAVVDVYGYFE